MGIRNMKKKKLCKCILPLQERQVEFFFSSPLEEAETDQAAERRECGSSRPGG